MKDIKQVPNGAKVAEVWEALGDEGGWNPGFARHFNDWEMDVVQDFIETIQNKKIRSLVKDRFLWKNTIGGLFSVKFCFDVLEGDNQFSAPARIFWNSSVPTKMGFSAWEVWWDKVLTMYHLKTRGLPLASVPVWRG